jgi:type I restriction-modification system DNA methylase subunit
MDYKKLSDDEIIELCKEKRIEYFNTKTKKNYARTTLISKIKKTTDITEISQIDTKKDEEIIIEYKNEIIWKLSEEDKKNNDEYNEIEAKLISCIKSCHDILYSNGSITGLKASNDIIKIIICRLFNVIYKNDEIKKLISSKISKEDIEKYEKYLIDINEFTKTIEQEIYNLIRLYIFKIIVPIFPNIFKKDDIIFNTRDHPKNFNKIINKVCELININDNYHQFIKLFAETGGNMYEYFTNSYGKGSTSKELGQFFTPFKLINLILFNIKEFIDINDNYSLYDPCCGSGGLLNRTASFLKINRNNIYGCEIEGDTTKYALASLLVNNNSLQINILNRCSLTNNNYLFEDKKFDLILTNPPFGTKMNYKDLETKFNDYRYNYFKSSEIKFQDIYPINTNNGASLFLQHVIYMLKDNGICGIVLPDGNELVSKGYYNIRKYLIDNCKIIKVINVSGGTFGSTGVKTKVIIFKKQKGVDNHKNIDFLEINKNCDELKLITTTDLDNNYRFKLRVNDEIIINNDYELIEFGRMFDLIKGTIQSSKVVEDKNSDVAFINLSKNKEFKKIKDFELDNENIFISNVSPLGLIQYYDGKCSYSNLLYHIKPKYEFNDKINIKYIYYILNRKQEFIENNYQLGCANKTLNIEEFNLMKLSIPSIEIQNKKVEDIDKLEASIETIKLRIEQIKHEQQYILLSKIIGYIGIELIEFGRMFDLIKGSIQSSKVVEDINGDGVFINWSIYNKYKKINNSSLNGSNLFISTKLPNGKDKGYMVITYYNGKCDYCDLMSLCKLKEEFNHKINIKYIYYYLLEKREFIENNYQLGCAQKSLNIEEFNLMKIPIPSIEKQKEIVDILDGVNNRMNEDIKYIEVLRELISKLI